MNEMHPSHRSQRGEKHLPSHRSNNCILLDDVLSFNALRELQAVGEAWTDKMFCKGSKCFLSAPSCQRNLQFSCAPRASLQHVLFSIERCFQRDGQFNNEVKQSLVQRLYRYLKNSEPPRSEQCGIQVAKKLQRNLASYSFKAFSLPICNVLLSQQSS